VKVLNGYYTKLSLQEDKVQWELEALVCLSNLNQHPSHCVELIDFWRAPGRGSADEHLFIATNLFGGDVRRLMVSSDTTPFPLKLAKRILLHTLRGIAGAHGAGIIHTDLKHDNIFKNALSTEQIDSWLASDPPCRHAPELPEDGTVQTAISQPLPIISIEEAMSCDFAIGHFGNGEHFLLFSGWLSRTIWP